MSTCVFCLGELGFSLWAEDDSGSSEKSKPIQVFILVRDKALPVGQIPWQICSVACDFCSGNQISLSHGIRLQESWAYWRQVLCSHFSKNYLITALSPTYSNWWLAETTALETKAWVLETELNRHKKAKVKVSLLFGLVKWWMCLCCAHKWGLEYPKQGVFIIVLSLTFSFESLRKIQISYFQSLCIKMCLS